MSATQVSSWRASATVLVLRTFRGTHLWTLGAKSSKHCPCNQRSDQNNVFVPLPTAVVIEIADTTAVFRWTGMSKPAQGRSGLVFFYPKPSHLQHPSHDLEVWMPSPPSSSGCMTFPQATKQHPPLASFLPFHKKLLILSIAWMNHLG